MSEYTPGPWYVSEKQGSYGALAVCADAAGGTLASVSGGYWRRTAANAHLIAANWTCGMELGAKAIAKAEGK